MSLDPPMLVQGSKRTASGMIKGSDSKTASPMPPASQHKRTKSTESGSHSRIGEVRSVQTTLCVVDGWWLMHPADIRPAAYPALLCHGQGAEWMGEEVVGRH
jgi:hypothetical protein